MPVTVASAERPFCKQKHVKEKTSDRPIFRSAFLPYHSNKEKEIAENLNYKVIICEFFQKEQGKFCECVLKYVLYFCNFKMKYTCLSLFASFMNIFYLLSFFVFVILLVSLA